MQQQAQSSEPDSYQKANQADTLSPAQLGTNYAYGVDIGRTHTCIYLAKQDGEIIDFHALLPFYMDQVPAREILQTAAQIIIDLARKNRVEWDLVHGIGVSIPGVAHEGVMISPALLGDWFNLDIPKTLRADLRQTNRDISPELPVHVDNDANMGALGEGRRIEKEGGRKQDFIYIKAGTGIGAGLFLNGEVYHGRNGAAGEFGHIFLEATSPEACASCGRHGCLEALAGEHAIIKDAQRRFFDRHSKPQGVGHIARFLNMDFKDIKIDHLVAAANNGNKDCLGALQDAGDRIGRAIGSCLINILNPSLIVLEGSVIRGDGGFSIQDSPLFIALRATAIALSMPVAGQGIQIQLAKLGDRAIPIGAIATVFESYRRSGRRVRAGYLAG